MNRARNHCLAMASTCCGLFAAVPASAASVQQVSRATWGASGVPSYVNMYIYVPDQLAANPPIVVACHSCGTPVSGYVNSITGIQAGADENGFVLILPEATGQNCWDVGSTKSLTHDGGGDTQAIAQMVKYALQKYSGDASRVYAMGGSSGAMMTQALMAVYPDVFKAGSARAGVAAGCWADGYSSSNQWSNNCAGGTTTKSAQQWGDLVRSMYPGYMGHRPRVQLFHGTADTTINYKNLAESIKEWTNVLGLDTAPTSTDTTTTPISTYSRQFWQNACGYTVFETWAGQNGTHSMAYEQDAILAFFGLDTAGGPDPEPACPPEGGAGGAGGMAGAGGIGGTSGASGAGQGGLGGQSAGGAGAGAAAGGGGIAGSAGLGGTAGDVGSGGLAGFGGASGVAGTAGGGAGASAGVGGTSAGGTVGSGGMGGAGGSATGGTSGVGAGGLPGAGTGGSAGSGNPGASTAVEPDASGCACDIGKTRSRPAYGAFAAIGFALLAFRRRHRGTKR